MVFGGPGDLVKVQQYDGHNIKTSSINFHFFGRWVFKVQFGP